MEKKGESVLLHTLTQLLAEGNDDFTGLGDQVRCLYNQFEVIPVRAKPAYQYYYDDDVESFLDQVIMKLLLVQEIAELGCESENVVDAYFHIVANTERFAGDTDHKAMLCSLRMHIKEIIRRISKYPKLYDGLFRRVDAVQVSEQAPSRTVSRSWTVEYDTVGLTAECRELVNRIIDREPQRLDVIPIVGEGGTGKSTLAMKVYNHFAVKNHFRCRGWTLVSKNYSLRDMMLSILSNIMVITEDTNEMEGLELKRLLKKELKGRRYLLVLDDVWDTEVWEEVRDVFPNDNLGSRIIVTTRSWDLPWVLASFAIGNDFRRKNKGRIFLRRMLARRIIRPIGSFNLENLNREDSWELFHKTIFFGDSPKNFPEEKLEDFGRFIVQACNGRPLVIVVVASILRANEMSVTRWSNVVKQIKHHEMFRPLRYPLIGPSEILDLCYNEIPQHLGTCFLYLGVFPEDFKICVKQLVQLWIAEGLIEYSVKNATSNMLLEEVAEDYLEELIRLNLIQVTERRSDGGPKSVRIHDLLRDLCIRSSPWHENFLSVYTGKDDSFPKNPRRLSILGDWPECMLNSDSCISSHHVLRAMFCFSQDNQSVSEENWELIFKRSPLLRVLYLGEGEVGKLPETINELLHLKYLRMKSGKSIKIPPSIFHLWNLQTIDLRASQFRKLPAEIWQMRQLRHLYLDGPSRLPQPKSEEDCLPNLLTLSYISIDSEDGIQISKRTPHLKKLGLYNYECASESQQADTFELQYIQSLKFVTVCIFEEPIILPATITKITVSGAPLQPNVIKMFEDLPCLQILKLVRTSFDDDELVFGKDSFPQLQLLKLERSTIVTWKLEEGAMSRLRRLVISSCSQLTKLPDELWKVNTLQELELFWASPAFASNHGEDLMEKEGLKLVIYPPLSSTAKKENKELSSSVIYKGRMILIVLVMQSLMTRCFCGKVGIDPSSKEGK